MAINLISGPTFDSAIFIYDTFTPIGGSPGSIPEKTKNNGSIVSAAIEVQSTQGGILFPRMTTAQRNTLNPSQGLMVYDLDLHAWYGYSSGAWGNIGGGGGGGGSVTSITAGSVNVVLTPNPLIATGTVDINTTLIGMVSVTVGNMVIAGSSIVNGAANLSLTSTNNNVIIDGSAGIALNSTLGNLTTNTNFTITNNKNLALVGSSGFSTTFNAGAPAAAVTYTLPAAAPTVSGQLMSCTTSGVMSWINDGATSGTVTSITASTNLTGGTITTSGSIGLSPTLTGLTSVAISGTTYNSSGATNTTNYTLASSGVIAFSPATVVVVGGRVDIDGGNALRFYNAGSTNYTSLRAGSISQNVNYTLPATPPTADGQRLQSTTAGLMSWVDASTGFVTSITAGTNLTGGTIVSSGTIGLAATLTGLTSVAISGTTYNSGGATNTTNYTLASSGVIALSPATVVVIGGRVDIDGGNALRLYNTGSTNYTSISAPNQVTNAAYTLPTALPAVNGSHLVSDTSGTMTWTSSAGTGTVTSITGGANLTGGTITSSGTLALNPVLTGLTSAAFGSNFDMSYVASDFRIRTSSIANLYITGNQSVYMSSINGVWFLDATTYIGPSVAGSQSQFLVWQNATGRQFGIRGPAGGSGTFLIEWPSGNPTIGQVMGVTSQAVDGVYSLSWVNAGGGGAGDVVGPASATDNALVRFNTTTGKLVQNSVGILDDGGNLSGLVSLTVGGISITQTGGNQNIFFDGNLTLHDNTGGLLTVSAPSQFLGDIALIGTGTSYESNGQVSRFMGSPSASASVEYTWPAAGPTVNGQIMSCTTAGVMSWVTDGAGSGTVTSITAGANMTGGTITSTGSIGLATTLTGLVSVGTGQVSMPNQSAPATPTGGGILYCNGGGLFFIGSNGTITQIATA